MMKRIDVIPTVKEIRNELLIGKTVIVIDVLRSTSTIVTAFYRGCKEILPVETVGQALSLMNQDYLLIGERYGKRLTDFDFSNSPYEIQHADVLNKKLIITTTNGTHAILKANRANHVLIGCFLNAMSVVKKALHFDQDITLLCAGTRDEFSLEDGLCAGYMVQLFQNFCTVTCSDFALLLKAGYIHWQDQIPQLLHKTTTGTRLVQLGYTQDILWSAQLNFCDIVPEYVDHRIFVRHDS